mmetsp:Transcript_10531/g.30078  ORF Transcript_10531/g.30078 Transcript_10531/m.30078 type:complete len:85 (-) Transcript_10531:1207-1461(-)
MHIHTYDSAHSISTPNHSFIHPYIHPFPSHTSCYLLVVDIFERLTKFGWCHVLDYESAKSESLFSEIHEIHQIQLLRDFFTESQ